MDAGGCPYHRRPQGAPPSSGFASAAKASTFRHCSNPRPSRCAGCYGPFIMNVRRCRSLPPPGRTSVAPRLSMSPKGFYEAVGYRPLGSRAVRIDIVERLAARALRHDPRRGLRRPSPISCSLAGCTLPEMSRNSLGDGIPRHVRRPRKATEGMTIQPGQESAGSKNKEQQRRRAIGTTATAHRRFSVCRTCAGCTAINELASRFRKLAVG